MAIVDVILALLCTLSGIIGLLFNAYVVISALLARQISGSSNILLLHLCSLNSLLTLTFLFLQSPNLFLGSYYAGDFLCYFQGFLEFLIHPLLVWNILGIHLDRFVSIAYPLRYASKITSTRVVLFLIFTWVWVLSTNLLPLAILLPIMAYRESLGTCFPEFHLNGVFTSSYLTLGILLPLLIIVACNLRIVNIAKYHQFRIANALFGMTVSAHHNMEGAKAREKQNIALRRFQGLNAIVTLTQLVGSLLLFYLPFVSLIFYESWAGASLLRPYDFIPRGCLLLLMANPICSGFIFGIKNKSLQSSILNFARKEIYKSEVQQEIRLRSPGGGGLASSRPSFGSFVSSLGHVTSQVPYLQRHLSELCLNSNKYGTPVVVQPINGNGPNLSRRSAGSCRRNRPGEEGHPSRPKPFKRHASDLTWRMNAAGLSTSRFNSVMDMSALAAGEHKALLRSNSSLLLSPPPSHADNKGGGNSNSSGNEPTGATTQAAPRSSSITDTEDEIDISLDSEINLGVVPSNKRSRRPSIFKLFENGSPFSREGSLRKSDCPKITITTVPTIDQSSLEFLYPLEPSEPFPSEISPPIINNDPHRRFSLTNVIIHVSNNGDLAYDVVDPKEAHVANNYNKTIVL